MSISTRYIRLKERFADRWWYKKLRCCKNKISSSFTPVFGAERPSKYFMFLKVQHLLFHLPEGSRVLDAACQTGWHISLLFPSGIKYTGIDIDNDCVLTSQQRHPEKTFIHMNLLNVGEEFPSSFDCIISTNTLYHLSRDDRRLALKSFCRAMNDSGVGVFSLISNNHEEIEHFIESGKLVFDDVKYLYYSSLCSQLFEKFLCDDNKYYVGPDKYKNIFAKSVVNIIANFLWHLESFSCYFPKFNNGVILFCRQPRNDIKV